MSETVSPPKSYSTLEELPKEWGDTEQCKSCQWFFENGSELRRHLNHSPNCELDYRLVQKPVAPSRMAQDGAERCNENIHSTTQTTETKNGAGWGRTVQNGAMGQSHIGISPMLHHRTEPYKTDTSFPTRVKWGNYVRPPQPDWLVKDLITGGGTIAMIAGKRASFKSTLAYYLAAKVATGRPLFGKFQTKKSKVCYWDCENSEFWMANLIEKLEAGFDEENKTFLRENLHIIQGSPSDFFPFLESIKADPPELLILDGLRQFLTGDENDSFACVQFFLPLKDFCKTTKCSVVFLHHARKDAKAQKTKWFEEDILDNARGSSVITAELSHSFVIVREKMSNDIYFVNTKNRFGVEISGLQVRTKIDDNFVSFDIQAEGEAEQLAVKQHAKMLYEALLQQEGNGFTTKEIRNIACNAGVSESNAKRAMNDLVSESKLRMLRKGNYELIGKKQTTITQEGTV